MCNEPSLPVIIVSVITQSGDSPLTLAVRSGRTEVVSLLVKAALDLQNKVNMWHWSHHSVMLSVCWSDCETSVEKHV